jgi:hypothetical protein
VVQITSQDASLAVRIGGEGVTSLLKCLVLLIGAELLVLGCESSGPAGVNAMDGGMESGQPDGGDGGTDDRAAGVDCVQVCATVVQKCAATQDLSGVWADACAESCRIKVQLQPEVAQANARCVAEATACDGAIVCVAL